MTGTVCKCVRSSLLVAVIGIAAVLSAPAVDTSSDSTNAGSSVQQRPDLSSCADWNSVRHKTICPAQVAYDQHLRVLQVWCADGVEGQTFQARGEQYVCRSVRYEIPFGESDVNVLGGCVARLHEPPTAAPFQDDS